MGEEMRALVGIAAGLLSVAALAQTSTAQSTTPQNVVLFVPDGMRAIKVDPVTAPAMAGVRDRGVNFANSHSLFPTFTTANAAVMATGHHIGDTGHFSNTIYTGFRITSAAGSVNSRNGAGPDLSRTRCAFWGQLSE
jgi:predicted AlkP superfamily pyrophosphatase or phosphodiesterase